MYVYVRTRSHSSPKTSFGRVGRRVNLVAMKLTRATLLTGATLLANLLAASATSLSALRSHQKQSVLRLHGGADESSPPPSIQPMALTREQITECAACTA